MDALSALCLCCIFNRHVPFLFSVLLMPSSSFSADSCFGLAAGTEKRVWELGGGTDKEGCGNKCPKFMVGWELSLAHLSWQLPGRPSNKRERREECDWASQECPCVRHRDIEACHIICQQANIAVSCYHVSVSSLFINGSVTNTSTTFYSLDTLEQNVLCLQADTEAVVHFCSVQTQFER